MKFHVYSIIIRGKNVSGEGAALLAVHEGQLFTQGALPPLACSTMNFR